MMLALPPSAFTPTEAAETSVDTSALLDGDVGGAGVECRTPLSCH